MKTDLKKKATTDSGHINDPFIKLYLNANLTTPRSIGYEQDVNKTSLIRTWETHKKYLQNSYWGHTKRVFDFVFSSLVVVFVLSWIFPILYILIKMESNGPVIFKQQRNGLNQKPFICYKFRSMIVNNCSDSMPTFQGDTRITKIGNFIRKYYIDEIPQFINVLKGEMSIIGPRPHMLSETKHFNQVSKDFYKRHTVKPGITGLAQINNCKGEVVSYHHLSRRIKYDLFYIKNANIRNDLFIIYRTVFIMLFGG